jgi:cytochrome c oxidase subunit 2
LSAPLAICTALHRAALAGAQSAPQKISPERALSGHSALDPAADQAAAIHGVWELMLWVCGFFYLLVLIGVAIVMWRAWRDRARRDPLLAVAEPGLMRGLIVWTALVVVGLISLTTASFFVDRKLIPGHNPALSIRITGKQWWWQIEYLNDDASQQFITANELHLPVDQPVHIQLVSTDVIHSFWVPNLSGKRDMIPGRVNTIELTPRRTGTFRGTCAEFCGLQHAKMSLLVHVDDRDAFEAWRKQQLQERSAPGDTQTRKGEQFFVASTCAMCHAIRGTTASSHAGPDLTHLASRRTLAAGTLPLNAGNLGAWLADPQRQKPGTNMPTIDLEPDDLNALVAYLLTLK